MRRNPTKLIEKWLSNNTFTCVKLHAKIHPRICANEYLKTHANRLIGTACYDCPLGLKHAKGLVHEDIIWPVKNYKSRANPESSLTPQWLFNLSPNKVKIPFWENG